MLCHATHNHATHNHAKQTVYARQSNLFFRVKPKQVRAMKKGMCDSKGVALCVYHHAHAHKFYANPLVEPTTAQQAKVHADMAAIEEKLRSKQ